MGSRLRRLPPLSPFSSPNFLCPRLLVHRAKLTSRTRPSLPFLATPTARSAIVPRFFTSETRKWLKHEAKLVVRYQLCIMGIGICVLAVIFALGEEFSEREFPTPHEWDYFTRKHLRDAYEARDPEDGKIDWPMALALARMTVLRLEDPAIGGEDVVKHAGQGDSSLSHPTEFISCDISAKSEEWRRGYFEAIMLAADAAEHTDGWLRDRTRNLISPPQYVIGPSNPRPAPIPPGSPHAPREEDCEPAFPPVDNYYLKILATEGFTPRQRMLAALHYASFNEYKGLMEGADALYKLALTEATKGIAPADLPYDPKTLVLKNKASPPSQNVLDTITAIATSKAHRGDVASALPIYLSLLRARRSLSDSRPRKPRTKRSVKDYEKIMDYFSPPPYPPAPPDGTQAPWRDAQQRCQEAALSLYIGEILFSKSPGRDGLAWTRDSVDLAEEQLRHLNDDDEDKAAKRSCRECLVAGLDNWATMVALLARAEEKKRSAPPSSSAFSFWRSRPEPEGRWEAELAVVEERKRRTRELMEDLKPSAGYLSLFGN